jgi:hypothetical protein
VAQTPHDLFRAGNMAGPRLDHLRIGRDLLVHRRNGADWVGRMAGGPSSYDAKTALRGTWWRLPAGTQYGDLLSLTEYPAGSGHWLWQPAQDMQLVEFARLLALLNLEFVLA